MTDHLPTFLTAEWRHLAMFNYEIDPKLVNALVPTGTELDQWSGRTFVSLVGFRFLRTRVLGIPFPFHCNFSEVNLRFYVCRREGIATKRGVVFVREIVPRRTIASVADEAGKIRKSCSDALGRITEVDEPGTGAVAGAPGQATVTVSGGPDQSFTGNGCPNTYPYNCPYTVNDSGTVWVSGYDFYASAAFGPGSTASAIASSLASGINSSSSPVTASASGSVVTITSKATGLASNYAIRTGVTWQNQFFTNPSFTACLNGATCTKGSSSGSLTGGTDSSVGSSPLVTLYKYDSLGNLLCVEQHGGLTTGTGCSSYPNAFDPVNNVYRVRQFFYDSMSRLIKAQNPETGTILYNYDSDSNCAAPNSFKGLLVSKVDARGVRVCYQYDALNRITAKTYPNASPFNDHTITYSYDASANGTNYGVGHRTGMTDASGSSSWTFDPMGRVWSETLTINSITKTISNSYNLDGSLAQVTYPTGSGSVLAYTYNTAAHLTQLKDTAHNITYFQSAAYYPPGELNQATYGATYETAVFNNRLQPCWFYATTGTQLGATTACTGTAGAATTMDLKYGFNFGSTDDGEVMSVTNNLDSNRSVTYTYDALNRIASASSGGTDCTNVPGTSMPKNWGETFAIDAWGNLTNRTVTKCSADGLSVAALNSNRLSGFGYDAAGNMTSNGGASYTYNAESQLKTTAGVTYTYDGDGQRVMKSNGTLYWGLGPMLESDLSGNIQREYIFAGGKRIARRDISGGAVHYFLSDRLGSTAVLVNATGTIENQYDYLPYGGERDYSVTVTNQNFRFTGKERDAESGLDNFGARFDASTLGRFMTPDWSAAPVPIPYVQLINPQSLNLYAYALNSPVTQSDLDGHFTDATEAFEQEWTTMEQGMATSATTAKATRAPAKTGQKKDKAKERIAKVAGSQKGSTIYEYDKSKDNYPSRTNKCNEAVADWIQEAGIARPQVKKSGILGWLGKTRDPTAKEWATKDIPGWSKPDSVANARIGDVIAVGHHDDNEGHVGIVLAPGFATASVNALTTPAGVVTVNTWGFRSPGGNEEHKGDVVVVRHYMGEDE